jgi:hypothetical protein
MSQRDVGRVVRDLHSILTTEERGRVESRAEREGLLGEDDTGAVAAKVSDDPVDKQRAAQSEV